MKNQHTPGPWKHDETWGLIKYGKTEICALHSGNEANAHLISAAPDLLSALREIMSSVPSGWAKGFEHLEKNAMAAIAKAEGVA